MGDFIKNCKNMISHVQDLLKQNTEWISRYAEYAVKINANMEKIKGLKKKRFHEWAPLYLYMTVLQAKGQMQFVLRYLGQDVAKLKVVTDKITISTKGFDKTNEKFFECAEYTLKLEETEWTSAAAASFRSHFLNNPKASNLGKRNEEHRIESMLLTEFSKKSGKDKVLCNIQPVKLAGVARFQMPTPLYASDIKNVEFAKWEGGGIDIISRIGKGIKLCIMELKDENAPKESPAKAILQGLAYATFITELLRSESGQEWWKIFGFSGKIPEQLELDVACVMPSINNNDTFFANEIIKIAKDSFHLHYIYFQEVIKIAKVMTSLKQCS